MDKKGVSPRRAANGHARVASQLEMMDNNRDRKIMMDELNIHQKEKTPKAIRSRNLIQETE